MLKKMVIIKHEVDSGKYLFRVPGSILLEAGDKVVCNTKRGKDQFGTCCCDSFLADPKVICPLFGTAPQNMQYVTGKVEFEKFDEAIQAEMEEEAEKEAEKEAEGEIG